MTIERIVWTVIICGILLCVYFLGVHVGKNDRLETIKDERDMMDREFKTLEDICNRSEKTIKLNTDVIQALVDSLEQTTDGGGDNVGSD